MKTNLSNLKDQEPGLLYYALTGSRAYGIHTEASDYDFRGIFINTPEEIYGLNVRDSQEYEGDITLHSLKKFVKLAAGANPNILELLFLPKKCVKFKHDVFQKVIDNRDLFLTRKAKHTYSGYAMSQLKRNKHKSTHGTMRDKYSAGDPLDPYDAKFAGHTIRLMINGIEILTKGTLTPNLNGDTLNMIKEIREGNFFDNATDFYAYAEKLDLVLDGLYDKSNLPKSPDIKAINNLLIECHEQYYEQ